MIILHLFHHMFTKFYQAFKHQTHSMAYTCTDRWTRQICSTSGIREVFAIACVYYWVIWGLYGSRTKFVALENWKYFHYIFYCNTDYPVRKKYFWWGVGKLTAGNDGRNGWIFHAVSAQAWKGKSRNTWQGWPINFHTLAICILQS